MPPQLRAREKSSEPHKSSNEPDPAANELDYYHAQQMRGIWWVWGMAVAMGIFILAVLFAAFR